MLCVFMNRKVSVVFYRNCFRKKKGSHVLCKSGRLKELVQDRHAVTTDH